VRVPGRVICSKQISEWMVLVACGFQSGWVCTKQVPERAVLVARQRKNGECWRERVRERAAERGVLGQLGSRTSGSGTHGLQNERFSGSRVLERAVLAGCGFQDGLVCSGRAPEQAVHWRKRAVEREVLWRTGSRTSCFGAAGL